MKFEVVDHDFGSLNKDERHSVVTVSIWNGKKNSLSRRIVRNSYILIQLVLQRSFDESWQKYWFVLEDRRLTFYTKKSNEGKFRKIINQFDLKRSVQDIRLIEVVRPSGFHLKKVTKGLLKAIQLTTSGDLTVQLLGNSDYSTQDWFDALINCKDADDPATVVLIPQPPPPAVSRRFSLFSSNDSLASAVTATGIESPTEEDSYDQVLEEPGKLVCWLEGKNQQIVFVIGKLEPDLRFERIFAFFYDNPISFPVLYTV